MAGARSRRPVAVGLIRLGLGAALGVGVVGLESAFGDAPGFDSLRLAGAGAFASGLFLGGLGPPGFAFAAAVVSWFAPPTAAPAEVLLNALAHLALGWLAAGAFRRFDLDRGLGDLRSYLGLLAAAVLGGAATGLLKMPLTPPALAWDAMGIWWAAILTSVVLLVPAAAVALAGRRFAGLTLVPIGYRGRSDQTEVGGRYDGALAAGRSALDWIGPLALVLAISALIHLLGPRPGGVEAWLVVLYVAPLLWAVHRRGLRGGILVGSAVGLAYLTARSVDFESAASWHSEIVGEQAGALGLAVVGALLGSSRDTERRLRRELQAANRRLRAELRRVVDALRSALGAKDAYTEGHVGRVASYAVATGRRLGMGVRELELLEVASLLHDVGKIGIPEKILHKQGPLAGEERSTMQRHPEIGARILDDLEELRAAAPLVRHHQERFDGRRDVDFPGYPDGLQGEQIPLGARVIAVVDAFDAMTSDRSYRAALEVREAVEVLRRERGAQFDPRVVDVFLEVLAERPWAAR